MSLLSAIGHLAHEFKAARSRYMTEREIGALPFDVQKDIGWPPAGDAPLSSKRFDR